MYLSFTTLGTKNAEFNGMSADIARQLVINRAAEFMLEEDPVCFGYQDYEVFVHYEWEVNFTLGYVSIPDSAFCDDLYIPARNEH